MRLLVLGGSVFLSKAVAADAVARGHQVVCACRGESGAVPRGAEVARWDRDRPVPGQLAGRRFDAVVDVARHPSRVRSAVAAFPDAHWVFVSTISVYSDHATPGGRPETFEVHPPLESDEDPMSAPEVYGAMKVACERIVAETAASWMVVRPGLIVGPGDPSGRFAYWPARITDGGSVLAPGRPQDTAQVLDVRDLAAWIVTSAEVRATGTVDGVGPVSTMGDLLGEVAAAVGAEPAYTWVPHDFLVEQGVAPWSGERSVPMWLPRPEYDGMLAHDPTPAARAGLRTRSVAETTRDTLAWLRATPDAAVTGLTRAQEDEVLAAWDRRG